MSFNPEDEYLEDWDGTVNAQPFKKQPIISIQAEVDTRFWALLPQINYNHHYPQIEFEWLCFGIYFQFERAAVNRIVKRR